MNKLTSFTTHKLTLAIQAAISALAAFFFYSCRANYVFLDTAVFDGIGRLLLSLMIVDALALLILLAARLYDLKLKGKPLCEYAAVRAISVICFFATIVFTIGVVVNIAVAGEETAPVIMRMARKDFPAFIAIAAIAFFAILFPAVSDKKARVAITSLTALCLLIVSLYTLAPVVNYKITSDPLVIDSGGDSYSVVFATSATGTGYVEYEYGGETVRLYDEEMGRIVGDSKIHTVKVPKAHLDNNSYRVGSKRVIEAYSYGSNTGTEILSREYAFRAPDPQDQQWLCVSDWHTRLDIAYDAIARVGDYDGVIMLGDAVPGLMFEDEIKEYIVEFGGTICKGEMPVVYIRGNHETRGEYAAKLPDYLGMDSFYYTASFGDYEFVVLDSGEDKPDDHPEYGGMDNYSQYRKDMVEWLSSLPASDKTPIVFSHAHTICIEEDLAASAYDAVKALGADYIIGGHYHTCEFFQENGVNVYLDGGHSNGKFTASKLTLSANTILFQAWNNDGEKIFEKLCDL